MKKRKNMKADLLFGTLLFLSASCSSPVNQNISVKERGMDAEVMNQLQGVWLDMNTESPVLKIQGDSLLYASKRNSPMKYKLIDDTLFVSGLYTTAYPVLSRTETSMTIVNPMGDNVSLYKTLQDNVNFVEQTLDESNQEQKIIKKDTVILHRKSRYRGYTTINPTSIKVVQPGLTEDGFTVDNVYYDNVIHICVYEGNKRLCGIDVRKESFEDVVPADFLQRSVLYDMKFVGVDKDNFIFHVTLWEPDGPCYYLYVLVNEQNELSFKSIQ